MPVLGIKTYLRLGMALAFAIVLAWGIRVNTIRGDLRDDIEAIRQTTVHAYCPKDEASCDGKIKAKDISNYIRDIAADRDLYQDNVTQLNKALTNSTQTITDLGKQSADQMTFSRQAVDSVLLSTQGRGSWITSSEQSARRTGSLSDAEELSQCKEALDELYQNNF
jgi:methyl-accepting chemotaxis protein